MTHPRLFREDKATQVASHLLTLSDGSQSLLKLIKLVHFADRLALVTFGKTITVDRFYALEHGMVVSSTYDCIKASPEDVPVWSKHILPKEGNIIRVGRPAEPANLSDAEMEVLEKTYRKYGHLSVSAIRKASHDLPEYVDPEDKGSVRIPYHRVLTLEGWEDGDIRAALAAFRAQAEAHFALC